MGKWIGKMRCKQNTFSSRRCDVYAIPWAQGAAGMLYKYSTIMTAKSQLYTAAKHEPQTKRLVRDGKIATQDGEVLTSGEEVLPERTPGTHTS